MNHSATTRTEVCENMPISFQGPQNTAQKLPNILCDEQYVLIQKRPLSTVDFAVSTDFNFLVFMNS